MNINSNEYWDKRFQTDWIQLDGDKQTEFFANIALKLMPDWFKRDMQRENYSFCDLGCAEGEAVQVFSKYFGYKMSGKDFSPNAVEKAKNKFPQNDFEVCDIMRSQDSFSYDVIFTSNVLEHFEQPWEVAQKISKHSKKYMVLMVPFRETMEIDEHFYKFNIHNILVNINDFSLIYATTIDGATIPNTLYANPQILLIYSKEAKDKKITTLGMYSSVETEKDDHLKWLEKEKLNQDILLSKLEKEKEDVSNQLEFEKKQWLLQEEQLIQERQKLNNDNEILQLEISKLQTDGVRVSHELAAKNRELEYERATIQEERNKFVEKETMFQEVINVLEQENNQQKQDLQDSLIALERVHKEFEDYKWGIMNSFSWRSTKLLRFLGRITRFSIFHQKSVEKKKQQSQSNWKLETLHKIRKSSAYPFIRKITPQSVRESLSKEYNANLPALNKNDGCKEELIDTFIKGIKAEDKVILVFSGVRYVDSEGQRNIRLISEAIKKGYKIIFAYWRWDTEEEWEESKRELIQIPIDYLMKNKMKFFNEYLLDHEHKWFLIEFPHPQCMEVLDIANSRNWVTIYDVIDDWEEFAKLGQAVWYDKQAEIRISNMVDINIATAKKLREKISADLFHNTPYHVISNGVDSNRMKRSERLPEYDFCKGDLQIGYFGHLTDAWFDWELVNGMAEKNPNWTFHIIGYGQPENLKVKENVILYGKKAPDELPKYASYWDVAIIPFINSELTLGVNPIKIYEYLQLRLPAVASNMPEIQGFPYTQLAIGQTAFEEAIRKATQMKLSDEVIDNFIKENTWEQKFAMFEESIQEFHGTDTYKIIYK